MGALCFTPPPPLEEVEEVVVEEVEAVVMVGRVVRLPESVLAAGPEWEMLARWMGTTWLTGALLSGG